MKKGDRSFWFVTMASDFKVDVKVNVRDYGEILRSTVTKLATKIRQRSRQDIARTGMGDRFVRGLTTKVNKVEGGYRLAVNQSPGFMKVFEYGGVSVGKPMLWFGITPDSRGIRARNYQGKLFRPKGKNVLVSSKDHRIIYVGVTSINHRQRFHLRAIAEEEANNFLDDMQEEGRK